LDFDKWLRNPDEDAGEQLATENVAGNIKESRIIGNASFVTEWADSVFDAAELPDEFHHECFAKESAGVNPSIHEDSEYLVLQE
jgi:hypothetical protein